MQASDNLKKYNLHHNDPANLQFEVNNAFTYFQKNKDHASIPHRHSFYQVIWFKKAGRHYVDYQTVNHPANTVFFINKTQVHYFCLDAPNEGFLFHFNDLFIAQKDRELMNRFSLSIFNEVGNGYVTLSEEDAKKIALLTSYIQTEILTKEDYYKDQVFHFFQNILFQIERLRKKEGAVDLFKNPEHKLAIDFKNLVFNEIDQFHSIDYYARKLGTSAKTLNEVAKEVLGNTPATIIKESRMLEAKRMLSNHKTSIKEVAYGLGFDDPTYFTKYFKKATGYTPKAFQKLDFQNTEI